MYKIKSPALLLFTLLLIQACINPLNIVPDNFDTGELVVTGTISDQPGPYTVNVSLTQSIFDNDLQREEQFPASRVVISDDLGASEELVEVEPGVFKTTSITGKIGRSYKIHVETKNGDVYESIPDKLNPPGVFDSLYFEYTDVSSGYGHQYDFYVNSHLPIEKESFVRWKTTDTYFIKTRPELHKEIDKRTGGEALAPFECSGVVVINHFEEQSLRAVGECTCCKCWVNVPEKKPFVSDGQFAQDGFIKKQYVGSIPINYATFDNKLVIDVSQQALSQQAYSFWKSLRTQIEATDNLFQPLYATLPSNIVDKKNIKKAHGFFFAVSEIKKRIILRKEDLPDQLPKPVQVFTFPCTDFDNSTTVEPVNWPE